MQLIAISANPISATFTNGIPAGIGVLTRSMHNKVLSLFGQLPEALAAANRRCYQNQLSVLMLSLNRFWVATSTNNVNNQRQHGRHNVAPVLHLQPTMQSTRSIPSIPTKTPFTYQWIR